MGPGEFEKYNQYTENDFLDDRDFIRYVRYSEAEDVAVWEAWLATGPPNENVYKEAVNTLRIIFSARRLQPSTAFGAALWADIRQNIHAVQERQGRRRLVRISVMAAAACILVALSGYWYYNSEVTIRTGYGEHAEVHLPDNSTVTLNANSSLRYYRAWWMGRQREVWLNGEGLFKVQHLNKDTAHIAEGERFHAYAGELAVEVLGTTFNVKQRNNQIAVALFDGRIRITGNGNKVTTPIILQPGQVLYYGRDSVVVTAVEQLTNKPEAWVNRKIEARGMTVQDIIDNYEQTYGYHIILEKPQQASKRIDGTISLEKEADLLYMLANILNANIERQGNNIYLRPK